MEGNSSESGTRLWHKLILERGENIMGHIAESGLIDVSSGKSHEKFAC